MRFSLKNNFLFSVVIPTLNNRNKYLKEAINSIEKQSFLPFEIIIVNNGEGTVETPKSFLKIRQVKIAFKSGVARARNCGAKLSKSQYIAFLDDDDLWGHNYLKNIKKRIDKDQPDCLIGRLDQLINNKIIQFKNAHKKINKDIILIRNPGITGSSTVIKKNVFLEIGGYNSKFVSGEDKSLLLELIDKKFKIATVTKSQAIIRQSGMERLSDSKNISEGIMQFYKIYKNKMSLKQKIINLYKIYYYRFKMKK